MAYDGVCFELSLNCPHCEKSIALNRVSESVLCDGCRRVIELPVAFWQSVLVREIAGSLVRPDDEGSSATSIGCGIGVTVQELCGHQMPWCRNPRCKRDFSEEELRAGIEDGLTLLECPDCGETTGMRVTPSWFEKIHPLARLLVGEAGTGDKAVRIEGSEGIPFHCYHCGSSLGLDPNHRSVKCSYCSNQVTVPDEIWVRINPPSEKRRWFVVLDVGGSAGVMPGDTDSFCAVASSPEGELVSLYHAEEAGEAGHPCRIIRTYGNGLLRWLQDGVEFDSSSRLLLSPGDGSLCIYDDSDRFLRFIDVRTGEPVCTVESAPDDEDESAMYLDYCEIACDIDGSILHHRDDGDLRRFDRKGTRLPLWPESGGKVEGGGFLKSILKRAAPLIENTTPEFEALADRPARLPSGIRIRIGWDGRLYVMSEDADRLAVLDHDGRLVSNIELATGGVIGELHDFGADCDGRVYLLFDHSEPFRDTTYPHLGRIVPGGTFEIWAGPRSNRKGSFIGEYAGYLAVAPDGCCFVSYDFSDMRKLSPGGEVVWRSPGTLQNEADQLEDLKENMKGKKKVRDRE